MLQDTVARLEPFLDWKDIYVVCGQNHVGQVRAQLDRIGEDQVIVEPSSRNTALCVALGSHYLNKQFGDEVVATLPADHVIQDVKEFHKVLSVGKELAQQGWLVTFGIQPSYPSTGFGYLKQGESLGLMISELFGWTTFPKSLTVRWPRNFFERVPISGTVECICGPWSAF